MSVLELLILLVVAGICGAVGQTIAGYSRGGCLVAVVLGFVGAFLGVWLSRLLGLPDLIVLNFGSVNFPIIWSIIGATLFMAALGLLSRRRRYWD
jgi:uncharacterized membrane protein YeaQ/YmgE (transglycosylase-associated protein family)